MPDLINSSLVYFSTLHWTGFSIISNKENDNAKKNVVEELEFATIYRKKWSRKRMEEETLSVVPASRSYDDGQGFPVVTNITILLPENLIRTI